MSLTEPSRYATAMYWNSLGGGGVGEASLGCSDDGVNGVAYVTAKYGMATDVGRLPW